MSIRPKLTFVDHPSPNFNDRKGRSILFLVIHDTAMDTTEAALERLCDPKTEVSAHYLVDENGTIYRLVNEKDRAWHAGVSYWDGKTDLNSSSIGIEISNTGSAPYPQAQMDSVVALSQDIVTRNKIRSFYIVPHSDIAPDRKQDPDELFRWQSLASLKLGVVAAPTPADYAKSKSWGDKEVTVGLAKFGYRPGLDLKILVTAFQRHYQEELFQTPENVGTADAETKARLACLLRRKAISDGIRARNSKKAS